MIYSIIVTYNPNLNNIEKLVRDLKRLDVVPLIIDNASSKRILLDCEIIRLSENFGIAKAQNIGIHNAIELGADHIIFFDQDSSISNENFIVELLSPIKKNLTKISAPIFIDEVRGFTYPIVNIDGNGGRTKYYPKSCDNPFYVNNVISSGTMVDVEVFGAVGLMKDELFIDYVDTEWCLRCASAGYRILVVPSAVMFHSIGDSSFSLLGFNVPKHSPLRRYYRIRNSFLLLRQKHIPKIMALREVTFSIIHQLILISVSKGERFDYFKFLFKGVKDGVVGKLGAY
ncbi:rhamnosyltransferase [Vibrio sp. DNB22_12_1]|uniref:rhamnosyltransferase n=1 Tax=unclassified Vibrio TaxID=2614977 RepID=UPI00406A6E0E